MLFFRVAIYPRIYIAAGDAYGLSDVLEFLFGCIFLVLLMASVIVSAVLLIKGSLQSKKSAIYLLLFSIFLFFIRPPLQSLMINGLI
ncbi:MAG: hypothetical protein COA76_05790 [Moritella sp.]|nr:MAG: hypothetical protein COA76_05790 [Moritella sp.]